MGKTRTRFAPSPTGYMHVGNLRTALFTYLTAKHDNGTFILRIEDTDQERLVGGSIDVVYKTMRETGLLWDEGPDVGGPVGPYIQSQRMAIFKDYAEILVKKGKAYYCFCSEERLDKMRADQIASGQAVGNYDRCCRNLPQEAIEENLKNGIPYVIRQKIPLEGVAYFDDLIYGRIEVSNSELEDQILLKSDGMPTYNFANVVDDHLMNITHVIRGNEYLSSAPKYNLLYQSFGWIPPVYIHCPPVMKDAHQKLSKRNGDASYQDLVAKGYLSDAILNYLLLLGWSPEDEQEIFSLEDMIKKWNPTRINKSPAIFDPLKLRYINFEYIKALTLEQFIVAAKPWMEDVITEVFDLPLLCKNLQPRTEVFCEIPAQIAFIKALPAFDANLYNNQKMKTDPASSLESLKIILPVIEGIKVWSVEDIFAACSAKAKELEVKNGKLLYPLGIALTGIRSTPGGGTDLCIILGKAKALTRISFAIDNLSKYLAYV
jgi:glutamyl-tRNA synthetase